MLVLKNMFELTKDNVSKSLIFFKVFSEKILKFFLYYRIFSLKTTLLLLLLLNYYYIEKQSGKNDSILPFRHHGFEMFLTLLAETIAV